MFKSGFFALLCAASAAAQAPSTPTPSTSSTSNETEKPEDLKRELEATRKEMKDMREEIRAQMATQSAAQGWQEEWVEEKRKLELFVPNGYFRVRPELFNKLDLNRGADPAGYYLFPRSPNDSTLQQERTIAGANMRFRFEPTFNISEEVRIKMQVDALDNVIMGSNPDYAFSRNLSYARDPFSVFSESQVPPSSMVNGLTDSIAVKRIYGEVSTPVGLLRFGRMGSNWGLGMLHNDGNCLDCNYGDTVDRLMFVTEPITGYFVIPMLDFNDEGPWSNKNAGGGQPFDLSNSDDSHSFILAIARRDTDQQIRAKLDNNLAVFNYGVHFTYRVQHWSAVDYENPPYSGDPNDPNSPSGGPPPTNNNNGTTLNSNVGSGGNFVFRNAQLYMPDVWLKYERKNFRLEAEGAAIIGNIGNRANSSADVTAGRTQSIGILQFGAVGQAEYKLMDGALRIEFETGFASGDPAPGFGNYPRRPSTKADGSLRPGVIDGPQYECTGTSSAGGTCNDAMIKNFRFNRDYYVDMILYRELLGGVTDSLYFKPKLSYRIAEGFDIFGAVIYSRAIFASSTPSFDPDSNHPGDNNLGIEINAGARYETEDGFIASLQWGILFPLGGLANNTINGSAPPPSLDTAQALRGMVGIKF